MALFCLRRHTATAASLNNSVCVCESICQAVIAAFLECRLNSVTCNILWSVPFFGWNLHVYLLKQVKCFAWLGIYWVFSFCLFALCKARIPVITFSGDKLVQAGCLIAPPQREMASHYYRIWELNMLHCRTPFKPTSFNTFYRHMLN